MAVPAWTIGAHDPHMWTVNPCAICTKAPPFPESHLVSSSLLFEFIVWEAKRWETVERLVLEGITSELWKILRWRNHVASHCGVGMIGWLGVEMDARRVKRGWMRRKLRMLEFLVKQAQAHG